RISASRTHEGGASQNCRDRSATARGLIPSTPSPTHADRHPDAVRSSAGFTRRATAAPGYGLAAGSSAWTGRVDGTGTTTSPATCGASSSPGRSRRNIGSCADTGASPSLLRQVGVVPVVEPAREGDELVGEGESLLVRLGGVPAGQGLEFGRGPPGRPPEAADAVLLGAEAGLVEGAARLRAGLALLRQGLLRLQNVTS